MRFFFFFAAIMIAAINLQAQNIDISTARSKAAGTVVTIKGIITCTEFGTQKYMQDNSGGICVYDSKLASAQKGDSVLLTGTLKLYNGELEVSPVSTVTILNSGNTLPAPKIVSFTDGFSSVYQGEVVQFDNVTFVLSGAFQGNQNYKIYQNAVQKEARVKLGVDLIGVNIPNGKVTLTGIMSHFENYAGAFDQLLLRSKTDIIQGSGPVINSVVNQINITPHSFTVTFNTETAGNTMVEYGLTKSMELGLLKDTNKIVSHSMDLISLNPATFYYVRVMSVNATDTSKSNISLMSTASLSSGNIRVYFNNPVDTAYAGNYKAIYLNKAIDDTLVNYIGRAKISIDMAIYNLNNQNISNISAALNAAATRGVVVRVVYDGSTTNAGISELSGVIKRISSPQGSLYGIMHNKFVVFDANSTNPNEAVLWTGSTNFTEDQINTDKNNVIIFQDQSLAKAYTLEFEEMFGSSGTTPNATNAKFGSYKTDNTPHFFNIGGKLVELYFSPTDNVTSKIIDKVNTADVDIYFATMVFTRVEIAIPMIQKFNSAVKISGIIGDISGTNSLAYDTLKPWVGSSLLSYTGSGIFHHKYMIVDVSDSHKDPLVLTGSHNWSSAANLSNDENTVVVHSADIANIYFQEWAKRFKDLGGNVVLGMDGNKMVLTAQMMKAYFNENNLEVSVFTSINENFTLMVYDLNGKMLFSREIKANRGNGLYEIPMMNNSDGMYIVRAEGNGIHLSTKVIK